MSGPVSPPVVTGEGERELPAYVSNGLIGLRVRSVPLTPGMALVSGYAGEHPERRIEAAAIAPYPLAGDIALNGVWLSDVLQSVRDLQQGYDFACGELTSRFTMRAEDREATCEVLTFASREDPTLVCQEVSLQVNGACDVQIRAGVDVAGVGGRALRRMRETPGEPEPACDGALLWESPGGLGTVGCAYVTEVLGGRAPGSNPVRPALAGDRLITTYAFRAAKGVRYRLRQITSLVPSAMHNQPDHQAARMAAKARFDGFDAIRQESRAAWAELWKGRIRLVGAGQRWQALADAAFFYLNASVHPSSPASTSIFGLATWHDYHYYYGHVMWDIEAFVTPVLSLVQPKAAEAILDYRFRCLPAARRNAQLMGRRGVQFPWESAPSSGDEVAPLPATAAWHEDHASLDVAHAFALHAAVTDDREFLRLRAWPVLAGVAEWMTVRARRTADGYAIEASMGIAEREQPVDNAAYTNMAAVVVLAEAARTGDRLGYAVDPLWREIAATMALPRRGKVVVSHDGFRIDEEKGATPDPLMGLWPVGYRLAPAEEQATLDFYLAHAESYIGSPMLSALYGVWAARAGDRAKALKLMEEGYAAFAHDRFTQILEYRRDRFPEQPVAGPFFANMGGFLSGLLTGFARLRIDDGDPQAWAGHDVVLPEGWSAIEVDRVFVHGRPMRLTARHGERATLTPID
ncbi:glycoside hydrolase family 65 protein [Caulobacter sp. KR2-114]|uniref:glycoside hydrolase family 65 protein n=1 Tax=Caulobacter sp. KR2-114 TaxID=3400912 RepID=UPI003C0CA627